MRTSRVLAALGVLVLVTVLAPLVSDPLGAQSGNKPVTSAPKEPKPEPVSVVNTPTVTVGNTPLPVSLTSNGNNPASQPYTQEVISTSCNASFCFFTFPAVPAGKRLVIQQLNLIVRPASTTTIVDQAKLTTSTEPANSSGADFYFPMTLIGMAGVGNVFNTYSANSAVVAYAEAGVQPALETANRTAGSTSDFGIATISGYLVDVP
jgi:hypothetical protein